MPLTYVTVTGTFDDGSGAALSGSAVFTPSETVYAAGTPLVTPSNPVTAQIINGLLKNASGGALTLLATDNTGLTFEGLTGFFYWTVAVTLGGVTQNGWAFFLPSSPSTVDLYALADGASGLSATYAALSGAKFTGAVVPAVAALTDGTNIAVNAALGNVFTVTLGGNRTLSNPTNPVAGQTIHFHVTQDGTGSRTLSYGTAYDFGTAGSPTLTTTAAKMDILGFTYDAGLSKWCYLGSGLGF